MMDDVTDGRTRRMVVMSPTGSNLVPSPVGRTLLARHGQIFQDLLTFKAI